MLDTEEMVRWSDKVWVICHVFILYKIFRLFSEKYIVVNIWTTFYTGFITYQLV